MGNTKKKLSERDYQQTLQHAYNKEDASLSVNGFVTGVIGRKVVRSLATTTLANDTEVFAFSENGTALYTITVVYSDDTLETLLSVERTA